MRQARYWYSRGSRDKRCHLVADAEINDANAAGVATKKRLSHCGPGAPPHAAIAGGSAPTVPDDAGFFFILRDSPGAGWERLGEV